ncbi:uncharacterized protein LOC132624680 [Lycium barbarum]|uniref:uncharacterized protein LOC132624680 n=1 Tax=Lycium barbarum TaxID=112863 RepID=UPI00293E8B58|nr:uncharacterized protein LOC132624680 [Lycium barbarum]
MAIKDLSSESAPGLDCYNGYFYQKCWKIIKRGVTNFVQSFFAGKQLTRFYSHSCLMLIPKVEAPTSFSQMRPISLSNFSNKILSKIVASRLNPYLPRLISDNQNGFINGRLITENVILAQEIVHNISKNKKKENMIIKLDMEKAYDRVSWVFLYAVLKKIGFNGNFIDIIKRLVEDAWYSVLINGDRKGFFHSSRGLKQGDPLSPFLFVISAKILSKMLNNLFDNRKYTGFTMAKEGPQINHLAYADDVVIFTSWKKKSLRRVMREEKDLLFYIYDHKDYAESWSMARESPLIWRESSHNPTNTAIPNNAPTRCYIPPPPIDVLNQIEKYLQDFYWGQREGKKKHHWAAWDFLCYPKDEGGVGFKSLFDIQTSFEIKRWWRIRTQDNLWTKFMNAKYCKRVNLVARKWTSGQSQSWKELMRITIVVEPHMLWKINRGESLFWWDNWTRIGPLSLYVNRNRAMGNSRVNEFIIDNRWNNERLQDVVPPNLQQYINQIHIFDRNIPDKCYWILAQDGVFSCATARDAISPKKAKNDTLNTIWHKKRCSARFSKIKTSFSKVIYEIVFNLKVALRKVFNFVPLEANWRDLCILIDGYKPKLKFIHVCWLKPLSMAFKLNTDGISMSKDNKAGAGGILRDHQGSMVMAFTVSMIFCSNNMAETQTSNFGLKWCQQNNVSNLILEIDSKLVVDMINGTCKPTWKIQYWITEIQEKVKALKAIVTHCYRVIQLYLRFFGKVWCH